MQKNDKLRKAVMIVLAVITGLSYLIALVFLVLNVTLGLELFYSSSANVVGGIFLIIFSTLNLIDAKNKKKNQKNEQEVNSDDQQTN